MHRHFKTRCTGALVAAALIVGSLSSPAVLADQKPEARIQKPFADKALFLVYNDAPRHMKQGETVLITVTAACLDINDVAYRPVKLVSLYIFYDNQRWFIPGMLVTNTGGSATFVWTVPDDWPVGETSIAGIACVQGYHYGSLRTVKITAE